MLHRERQAMRMTWRGIRILSKNDDTCFGERAELKCGVDSVIGWQHLFTRISLLYKGP